MPDRHGFPEEPRLRRQPLDRLQDIRRRFDFEAAFKAEQERSFGTRDQRTTPVQSRAA